MNLIILGTRPEIIKLYPLINLFNKKKTSYKILHTGQHYTKGLSEIFLRMFEIPKKKLHNLNIGSDSHGSQTSLMMNGIEKFLKKNKIIDNVIVYGDTNSALAGALVVSKLENVILTHIEAGLRSFDKNMPEEINRRLIDHCSDILFCPTKISKQYLIKEGLNKKKIFYVGNTIVDTIYSDKVTNSLNKANHKKNQLVLTIHREENTKNIKNIKKLFQSVYKISKKYNLKVIFPIHPKTQRLIKSLRYNSDIIKIIDPLNYFDFLNLIAESKLVISDSGGVQEEACILKTPLITVRNSTERPETLMIGCNILSKIRKNRIFKDAQIILNRKINWSNPYGDVKSSHKILNIINTIKKKNVKYY